MSAIYIPRTLADLPEGFSEMAGSPMPSYRSNGYSEIRQFEGPWTSAHTFCTKALGWSEPGGDSPRIYEPIYSAINARAYCIGADFKPMDATNRIVTKATPTTANVYEKALITLRFEAMMPVYESFRPASEMISLPPTGLKWADGTPLGWGEGPAQIVGTAEWVVSTRWYPAMPISFLNLMGCVNKAAVKSGTYGYTFNAETLLFIQPIAEYEIDPLGATRMTVHRRFLYRSTGWNQFFRNTGDASVNRGYQRIKKADGSDFTNYHVLDFAPLNASHV